MRNCINRTKLLQNNARELIRHTKRRVRRHTKSCRLNYTYPTINIRYRDDLPNWGWDFKYLSAWKNVLKNWFMCQVGVNTRWAWDCESYKSRYHFGSNINTIIQRLAKIFNFGRFGYNFEITKSKIEIVEIVEIATNGAFWGILNLSRLGFLFYFFNLSPVTIQLHHCRLSFILLFLISFSFFFFYSHHISLTLFLPNAHCHFWTSSVSTPPTLSSPRDI